MTISVSQQLTQLHRPGDVGKQAIFSFLRVCKKFFSLPLIMFPSRVREDSTLSLRSSTSPNRLEKVQEYKNYLTASNLSQANNNNVWEAFSSKATGVSEGKCTQDRYSVVMVALKELETSFKKELENSKKEFQQTMAEIREDLGRQLKDLTRRVQENDKNLEGLKRSTRVTRDDMEIPDISKGQEDFYSRLSHSDRKSVLDAINKDRERMLNKIRIQ